MDNLSSTGRFMVKAAIVFYAATLPYIIAIIKGRKAISQEVDKSEAEAKNGIVSEKEKSRILMKTHQMIIKPLKTTVVLVLIGTIVGVIGLFLRQ